MADLLSKTQCGQLDASFLEVAHADAKALPYCFQWGQLFSSAGSEAKDDNIQLTDLRAVCLKWLESMLDAPRAAASDAQVGDEDRCIMAAVGADVDEDGERQRTVAKLNRMLG